jgi:hypothetical protein
MLPPSGAEVVKVAHEFPPEEAALLTACVRHATGLAGLPRDEAPLVREGVRLLGEGQLAFAVRFAARRGFLDARFPRPQGREAVWLQQRVTTRVNALLLGIG